ncbi:hypothetical protein BH10ACI1_BH10ACI1_27360 [soil metagenome]
MNEEENKIKGGVIIIGSLFWEDKDNAIQEKESIDLAEKRKEWRETYLDLDKKEICKLPIRYGRCSSSRKCTYTMVFSSLALNKESSGLVIPYKEEISFSKYSNFEEQAKKLAIVEGISKGNIIRLKRLWGCIAIYINPTSTDSTKTKINDYWNRLKLTDGEYAKQFASDYKFENLDGDHSLLDINYCLREEVEIDTKIDFLFFTYIKAEHRKLDADGKTMQDYPIPKEIAEEINRSGYKTYFEENKKSGITTFEDININPLVK